MTHSRRLVALVAAFVIAVPLAVIAGALPAAAAATTRYVATTGANTGDCSVPATPCLTIPYAVGQAVAGDTVQVAAGTYPEMVVVQKDNLTFRGANAGIAAGTSPGTRGAESIVKGFRNASTSQGSVPYSMTIDGFQIDAQGDAAQIASGSSWVWVYGGPTLDIANNVFYGGAYVSGCSYTCTTMGDSALDVTAGNVSITDNSFTNFRRPLNIQARSSANPVLSLNIERNAFSGVTSRAIQLAQNTGVVALPGATVSNNSFDATGRTGASTPAGMVVTNADNHITDNTFTSLSSGIYLYVCNKFDTKNQVITGNTFTGNDAGVYAYQSTVGNDGAGCATTPGAGGSLDGTTINQNNMTGNAAYAIGGSYLTKSPAPTALDSTCNWYGSASGPSGNGPGTGDAVYGAATYSPWEVSQGGPCVGGVAPAVSIGDGSNLRPTDGFNGAIYLPVTLSSPAASPVTVSYYTLDDTASGGVTSGDYRIVGTPAVPRTITIPAGSVENWISIPIFSNASPGSNVQFEVVLAGASGASAYVTHNTGTASIVDGASNEGVGPAMLISGQDVYRGTSGVRKAQFVVRMSHAASGPVTITYTTQNGTASAPGDYTTKTGSVTLGIGQTSKTLDVLVQPTAGNPGAENFTLSATVTGAPVSVIAGTPTSTILVG